MITATQGLKECLQQLSKLEAWIDQGNIPQRAELRKELKKFRTDVENIIQEVS